MLKVIPQSLIMTVIANDFITLTLSPEFVYFIKKASFIMFSSTILFWGTFFVFSYELSELKRFLFEHKPKKSLSEAIESVPQSRVDEIDLSWWEMKNSIVKKPIINLFGTHPILEDFKEFSEEELLEHLRTK